MDALITTILNRPYVVAFLISYILIARRVVGMRWTINYLIVGYTIAFVSEFYSINYGFPYGWYFYKYENLAGEWLNRGVPVWDSVSYVFLCFAGLYTAAFALNLPNHQPRATSHEPPITSPDETIDEGRGTKGRHSRPSSLVHRPSWKHRLKLITLSAALVTILDIIVDPVSHLGARWFLGEIYYYPNPGFSFDVTLANFAGWFLVSFAINALGVFVLRFDQFLKMTKANNFLALGLYFGIFGFGVSIAVYLREYLLLLCDAGWMILVFFLISALRKKRVILKS